MEILTEEPMKFHTTFRTGGNARKFLNVQSAEEIAEAVKDVGDDGLIVVGNGSNLLVSDEGFDGTVLHIREGFDGIQRMTENEIYAEAGALLSNVARSAWENGLTGLEFASGIPGTVGGAVVMNAGAYGGEIQGVITSADVLVGGERRRIPAEDMHFGYRHSLAMEEPMIILGATFQLTKGEPDAILQKMQELNSRRREKQPLEYPSAGSTFKRPEGYFAGKLIMDAGLAGTRLGGAMVSPKHCGFIVNYDHARSADIYNLICLVIDRVREIFGVTLEPEVRMIGHFERTGGQEGLVKEEL